MTTDSVYPNKHGTDITTQYTVNVYVQNLVKCSQNITFTDHSLTLVYGGSTRGQNIFNF